MRVNVSNIFLSLVLSSFYFNFHIILVFHLLHMCLLQYLLEVHIKCLCFCHKNL